MAFLFSTEDADKENILIAYLPNGQYVGIRLFQSRPTNFKNEAARLNWDKQAASNAITLKLQLGIFKLFFFFQYGN